MGASVRRTPGSRYLLLATRPGTETIASFDVLERTCPKANVRSGPLVDIARTDYCAIRTRAELVSLARRMARRPSIGRFEFVSERAEAAR